jgi:hypothetical protein
LESFNFRVTSNAEFPEDAILSGLPPDTAPAAATSADPAFPGACPEHGQPASVACAERLERVRAIAEARNRGVSAPGAVSAAGQTAPALPLPQAAPAPEPEAQLVELAQCYANALRRLDRERKLLIGAELRVEHLRGSIAALRAVGEGARGELVAAIPEQ